jgi:dolichyl-phosphate-mannose-protein mannosyltransferase
MWTSNNALVPDPDKFDVLASTPFDWPFQHLGLRMCGWGDNQIKYYLIGTPLIWMGSTVSLFVGLFLFGFYLFRQQRKYVEMEPRTVFHHLGVIIDNTEWLRAGEWDHLLYVGKISFFGWFFHFGTPPSLHLDRRRLT